MPVFIAVLRADLDRAVGLGMIPDHLAGYLLTSSTLVIIHTIAGYDGSSEIKVKLNRKATATDDYSRCSLRRKQRRVHPSAR